MRLIPSSGCSFAVAIGLLALAVACTRSAAPDPAASPASPASASAVPSAASALPSASAAAATTSQEPYHPRAVAAFQAWTDPAATTELVKSCHANAVARQESEGDRDPLQCQLPWQQSCAYDPCWSKLQQCRATCGGTCGTCDATCATTCDTCKEACKDEACALLCAKKTGECKQGCLTAVDRCSTADCAKVSKACRAEENKNWQAHGCSCDKIKTCTDKCMEAMNTCRGDNCPDVNACNARCGTRFPGCEVMYCIMGSEPGRSN